MIPAASRPRAARLPARGLYAVTDGPREDLLEAASAALEGGAVPLQHRDKTGDADRRLHEARALVALCGSFSVPLIVNDDVELARASDAAGVHVGADDPDIATARAALESGAIDSLQRACAAAAAGPDYLAFSSPYASTTRPGEHLAPATIVGEARAFGLPIVIGGITPENAGSLVAAGADFLAVASGVFGACDMRAAARKCATLLVPD